MHRAATRPRTALIAMAVAALVATVGLVTLSSTEGASAAVDPSEFVDELRVSGFDNAVAVDWLPDGRALVLGQAGKIWIADVGAGTKSLYVTIPDVDSNGERGTLDLVVAPDFAASGHIYIFYTSLSDQRFNIGRLTYTGAGAGDVASLTTIWSTPDTNPGPNHAGGSLDIGPDGHLYVTIGDGTDSSQSQQLTNIFGKILRIATDGSVPAGNPFDDGAGPNVDEIYAYGVRNPWRGSFDDVTGTYFFGDVGGNNPLTAYEEINVLAHGADYGWADCQGPLGPPKVGPDCPAGVEAPLYSYLHFAAAGCCSAVGGEVVRGAALPVELDGAYVYADFNQEKVFYLELGAGNTVTGQGEIKDGTRQIVWLGQGPDGHIYYVRYGYQPGQGELRRLRYVEGLDQPPVVNSASASPTSGVAPLAVTFAASASDPDGDTVTYEWDFGDGTTSSQRNVGHTYTSVGTYIAQLRVTAGGATTVGDPITIVAGLAPTASIDAPPDGLVFSAGDSISLEGSATDDGPIGDDDYRWDVWLVHDAHQHPELTTTGATVTLDVPTTGHGWEGDTSFLVQLTVTDAQGLTDTDVVEIEPRKVPVTVASDAGNTVSIDGVARLTPYGLDTVAGFEHTIETAPSVCVGGRQWLFDEWSDGVQTPTRQFVVPTSSTTLTARYTDTGPCVPTCDGQPATVVIAAGDTPTIGADVIVGTPGDDVIRGLGGDDVICGGGGADDIEGGAGDDKVFGQVGADRLVGGIGDDVLDGGPGDDELIGSADDDVLIGRAGHDTANGSAGNDVVEGRNGDDVLRGGIGVDLLVGHGGADDLFGGAGDDVLRGGAGADLAAGAGGDDRVEGGPGDDVVKGSLGADEVFGNGDDDRVVGEAGDDVLHGGVGVDACFGGADNDTASACERILGIP
ncbi:MAG: PQQ-dependent sugar dehydrogenase [Acidimicrobiia bacterium]|nr:PQQ-dependent sugar dehydrogenase [Acidimicrobiia bacterium]